MKNLLVAIFCAAPLIGFAAPMTNDDVIKMVKGGLGDATVVQAIDAAEAGFDTSADGLVKLKQGGVSDNVIQRIIARKGAAPAAAGAAVSPPVCRECGTVTGIREINKPGHATGVGAVAGGVLGGVLGRSIGGRDHRTAGTVVGAAGGAVAGHMIEKKAREGHVFEIGVRFDDGSARAFTQETHPSWNPGSRVKLVNGALTPL
ncbi:MAG: glycine zipper 2TM domain-containing protein [Pseudomonadota bacterium]